VRFLPNTCQMCFNSEAARSLGLSYHTVEAWEQKTWTREQGTRLFPLPVGAPRPLHHAGGGGGAPPLAIVVPARSVVPAYLRTAKSPRRG
jgi:hypothetical protein